SSRVNDGLASASTMSAIAVARTSAPRLRVNRSVAANNAATANATHTAYPGTSGANETLRFIGRPSLPQPLKQRRDVDLIGLVVAGQGVHHDVDAGAEGIFPL